MIYVVRNIDIDFEWKDLLPTWQWREVRRILKLGLPSGLQFFFEVTAFALAAVMAGLINAENLAAHQIVIGLASFTYMFSGGLSTASMILIGEYKANENWVEIDLLSKQSMKLTLLAMMAFSVFFLAGKNILPQWFTDNEAVIQLCSSLMLLAALFQLFDGVQAVSLGFLRGISDTFIPSIYTMLVYWVITIPLCYYLGISLALGLNAIWFGITIGLVLASIVLYGRFRKIVRRNLKVTSNLSRDKM